MSAVFDYPYQCGVGSLRALYITKNTCTRLATACDKVYQLLALGRWFSPGTPASSTTKTGRHDIDEFHQQWRQATE